MNGCHTSLNSKFDDYVHAPVFWDICIDPCHPSPCGAKKAPTKQLLMQYFEEDVTIIYIIMLNSSDSKQEAFQVWFSKKTSYPLDHAPSHQVITRDHQNIPCFHMFSASSGGDLAAVLQLWELVAGRWVEKVEQSHFPNLGFSVFFGPPEWLVPRLNRGLEGGLPLSVPNLTFSETWGSPKTIRWSLNRSPTLGNHAMILKDISNILKPANPIQQSNRAFLTVLKLRGINFRGHWTREGKKLEKAGTSFLFGGPRSGLHFFGKALDQSHWCWMIRVGTK